MTNVETYEIDRDFLLRDRYRKWSKIILLIGVIYFIWTIFVVNSIYYLEMGYRWSILSMDEWIYLGCFLLGFFIVLELVFFGHYMSAKKSQIEIAKPKSQYYDGKRLYIYTHPKEIKGGVFSKTHISIDEANMLRLRVQIIPPEDIWK